jgi:hypothetical protein
MTLPYPVMLWEIFLTPQASSLASESILFRHWLTNFFSSIHRGLMRQIC